MESGRQILKTIKRNNNNNKEMRRKEASILISTSEKGVEKKKYEKVHSMIEALNSLKSCRKHYII